MKSRFPGILVVQPFSLRRVAGSLARRFSGAALALAIVLLLAVMPAAAQNTQGPPNPPIAQNNLQAQTLTLLPQRPVPPVTIFNAVASLPGNVVGYFYWVVSHDAAGNVGAPSGPFLINVTTVSASYPVALSWTVPAGVVSVDILRTATSATPSGTSTIGVASALSAAVLSDTGSLSSYTVNTSASQIPQVCTNLGGCGVTATSNVVAAINVKSYGAKVDGRTSLDGVLNTTTTVTSATLSCTSADIGKLIFTVNGLSLAKLSSTVASCSGASFIANAAATASESGDILVICSDDTTALQNAWAAALAASEPLQLASGISCVTSEPFDLPNAVNPYPANQAYIVQGYGLQASIIGIAPSFSFASVTQGHGAIFSNAQVQCGYENNGAHNFSIVTARDFTVTGFKFNFPGWPNTTGALYGICDVRRVGVFAIQSTGAVGIMNSGTESRVEGANVQGLAGTDILESNSTSVNLVDNILAYSGTGLTISGCTLNPCIVRGGLITGNTTAALNVSTGSVVNVYGTRFGGAGATTKLIVNDGTSTTKLFGVQLGQGATGAIGISNLSGGSVYATGISWTISSGTPTEVNNAGNFFDLGGNNLTGPITNSGAWYGSASITGTAQVSGNITPTGWGTGAAVSSVSGDSRAEQFTVTAGTSPSANPTLAIIFATSFSVAPVCTVQQIGGTGIVSDVTQSTLPTTTGVTLTWQATPTSAATYIFSVRCGS